MIDLEAIRKCNDIFLEQCRGYKQKRLALAFDGGLLIFFTPQNVLLGGADVL